MGSTGNTPVAFAFALASWESHLPMTRVSVVVVVNRCDTEPSLATILVQAEVSLVRGHRNIVPGGYALDGEDT